MKVRLLLLVAAVALLALALGLLAVAGDAVAGALPALTLLVCLAILAAGAAVRLWARAWIRRRLMRWPQEAAETPARGRITRQWMIVAMAAATILGVALVFAR